MRRVKGVQAHLAAAAVPVHERPQGHRTKGNRMRVLIQRVSEAAVSIGGETVGAIGPGMLALICAMPGDTDASVARLAGRIAKLRIFKDDDGRMNRSILDAGGAVLAVSQFTLAADTSRGNRPGFTGAASPAEAERLYLHAMDCLRAEGLVVAAGRFGADMQVSLVNDGPVTIWIEG